MKLFLLFIFALSAVMQMAAAEPRTALVMGVWEYTDPNFPALPGIADDVKNMSAKLAELGFEVTTVKNPTLSQARDAVDAFSATLKTRKGVGLFYFSGHGCEHEGGNFLIPRGTHIARRADVGEEALSAQRVLNGMEDAGTGVNIVFLDCCRNGLSKGSGSGLAAMQASGTFIGFATASTKEANAAQGGSIYTQALLKYLGTPGVSIMDMHTMVTREVKKITTEAGSPQIPFQYSGLDDVFVLVPKGTVGEPVASVTPPVAQMPDKPPSAQPARSSADAPSTAAPKEESLSIGDSAPNADGVNQNGKKIRLADLYKNNKYVCVFFYPKADTPGSIKQACSLRDISDDLEKKGVGIVGISTDSVAEQRAFRDKFLLNLMLLADKDAKIIRAFHVEQVDGLATRQCFLIKNGRIVWHQEKASTAEQGSDLVKALGW